MVLVIDNYDSFTYNLVQYFRELGQQVDVARNDEISVNEVISLAPNYIVISPGPCDPDKAGISLSVIEKFSGVIPILGVCLGHQCIGQAFGGDVVRAKKVMHGRVSKITHNNTGIFNNIPEVMKVTRYHSLVVKQETLPSCFDITAWTTNEDGSIEEIMAIKHKNMAVEGVQFHPESILSDYGHKLLENFLTKYK